MNIFSLIKELEINEPQKELIEWLREYFDSNIRHAMIGQRIRTQAELFKLLIEYDNDDTKERYKKNRILNIDIKIIKRMLTVKSIGMLKTLIQSICKKYTGCIYIEKYK